MQENSNEKRRLKESTGYAKMGYQMKVVKGFNRMDPPSFGVGLVAGCFLVLFAYAVMPKYVMLDFPTLKSQPLSSLSFAEPADVKFVSAQEPSSKTRNNSPAITGTLRTTTSGTKRRDSKTRNNSPAITGTLRTPTTSGTKQRAVNAPRNPLCDRSNIRSDICDVEGDVRVIGKNLSSVVLVTTRPVADKIEPWIVQPYARKWDRDSLNHVTQVHVKALHEAPGCDVRHAVPAVVFSTAGYTGNYFHDYTDVLVPLFQTARQFYGEVQLVVANYKPFWFKKYETYISALSRYPLINYDNDERVHCYDRVIVGLRSDRDMMIDPSNSPMGYSMADFMKFMRTAYALGREHALNPAAHPDKKPRLLVVARGRTRKFVNLPDIVQMAEGVGFEVVVAEANFNSVAEFARVVNSCDAIMGVHGAGLTNFVFLPVNAVIIQVVPFGPLEWISSTYFGEPSKRMNLRYLEYNIGVEESTLTELYSRDDPLFKDPNSIQKEGWSKMEAVYLDKQNVKLDVNKFRPVLRQAMKLLSDQRAQ